MHLARAKARFPLPVAFALGLMALISFPTIITLGPMSALGWISLAMALLCLAFTPYAYLTRHLNFEGRSAHLQPILVTHSKRSLVPAALFGFAVLSIIRLIFDPSREGLQNVAIYICFIASIAITAARSSQGTADVALRAMRVLGTIVSVLFIILSELQISIYGDRPFAITALVFLAVLIPHRAQTFLGIVAPIIVTLAIVLSLSRTASLIALAMLAFSAVRGRRGKRLMSAIIMTIVISVAAIAVVSMYAPLRERFFGGDGGLFYGDISFNTSGRAVLWDLIINSALQAPILGHGPGSATDLILASYPNIAHPHNEFLRLFHDFGLMGLFLFCAGAFALLRAVVLRIRKYDDEIHWAALIALLSVLLVAVTDNAFVYIYVMVPLGSLIGMSLSFPARSDRTSSRAPATAGATTQVIE